MAVSLPPLPVIAPDLRLAQRARTSAVCSWFLATAITLLALAAWKCPPAWPALLLGGTEMMRPITALLLALATGSLGLILFVHRRWSRPVVRLIGLALAACTVIAFAERVQSNTHGISRWAFLALGETPSVGLTPWMAPNVALCLIFIAFSLICLPTRPLQSSAASQWLGIAALLCAALALLGYAYGVRPFFLIGPHTAMAIPSAIGFGALALGLIGAQADRGPAAWLLAPTLGAYAVRRLLPATVLIPPIIGCLVLHAHYSELLDLPFAIAIFTVANVLIFAALIVAVACQTVRLEQALNHQRAVNRALLETTPAPLFLLDADNRITFANQEVEPLFGWSLAELLNSPLQTRLRPRAADGTDDAESPVLRAAREGRVLRDHEEVFHTKDGRPVDVLCATTPLRDEAGAHGAILLALDVTSRNEALREQRRSEERFAIISGITNDVIWDWDLARQSVWWNHGLEKLSGHPPVETPETLGSWEEHIHPDDRARVMRSIYQVIETGGREWSAEYRYCRDDGEVRLVLDRGGVIRDEQGRALRVLGGMTDITERKRAEESLHFAVRRFETLANLIPQFVWSARPDGYHDYFNERWHEFTGMPREGDLGWNWKDYVHPDDLGRSLAAWAHCLATGEPYQVDYRFRRARDGAYVWFMGRALPIRDPEGRISRWFGTCTDIDDQRRAGEQLEALVHQRTAQLRESVAHLEHFSYTLTHDMRAPLRAMQGYAHMLMEEHAANIDAQGLDYLRRIMSAAGRMDHLIIDALNYSKVVKTELPLTPVETGPLLRGLVESYPEFQPPGARIELIEPLPVVLGNVSGLTQCFSNLLTNAVKFVRPGEQPRVRVWSEDRGDRVCLWVEDNGIGIAPLYRERIFLMFERLDPAYEGTGVGLALVRKVTERMRGHVGVESAPEGGSRFWLELAKA